MSSAPASSLAAPVGLVVGCRTCGRVMWAGSLADCAGCRAKRATLRPGVLAGKVTSASTVYTDVTLGHTPDGAKR